MTEDWGQIPEGGRMGVSQRLAEIHMKSQPLSSLSSVGLLSIDVAAPLNKGLWFSHSTHCCVCVIVGLSVPRMETFAQPHG